MHSLNEEIWVHAAQITFDYDSDVINGRHNELDIETLIMRLAGLKNLGSKKVYFSIDNICEQVFIINIEGRFIAHANNAVSSYKTHL